MRGSSAGSSVVMAYSEHLCTFIDILGFSAMVEGPNRVSAEKIEQVLSQLHAVVQDPQLNLPGLFPLSVWTFSDCVVRAILLPQDPAARRTCLHIELFALAHAQRRLARAGVNLRGGMTIGDLSSSPRQVFGPAMVRAYHLEQSVALNPRIVVDREVLEAFDFLSDAVEDPEVDQVRRATRGFVQQDLDGQFFVHYLNWFAIKQERADKDEYLAHRDLLRVALQTQTDPRVLAKIHWQAAYHDRTIRGIPKQAFARWGAWRHELLCDATDGGPIPGDPVVVSRWPRLLVREVNSEVDEDDEDVDDD